MLNDVPPEPRTNPLLPDPDAHTLPPAATPASEKPGVPGYEILGELGRGGMGVVYKARQLSLNRPVALKMILAGSHAADDDLVRFRSEAEAIARLQHPNIVQVHEVGSHEGLPFFSLEFCAGGSLDKKLAGTPLPGPEAAELVEILARAIQAAHDAGIVHRDLKPANVLLAVGNALRGVPGGEDGTPRRAFPTEVVPKITDFGVAKMLGSSGQTQSGAIVGTPSYMSPEQAGGHKDVGPLADVYSLGAILYECLTGRPPFKAPTPMNTLVQVLSEEAVPPRQLNASAPLDLETICLKCLSKPPLQRYRTALDLADDLRRYLAGEPIAARPLGVAGRLWRWCKRKPSLAAACLLGLFVLAGAIAVPVALAVIESNNSRRLAEEKDKTEEALGLAESNEIKAREAERRALEQAADSSADSAQQLCERGEVAHGLLKFAHALTLARQARAADLEDSIRWNLGAWSRELHTLERVLPHPKAFVRAVAFHPDGKLLATGGNDGIVRFWDAESGRLTGQMAKRPGEIRSLVWQPGGRRLAIVSDANWFWLHKPGAEKPETSIRISLTGYGEYCWRPIAFNPDGSKVLIGGDGPARVYDTRTGQPTGLVLDHGDIAEAVAWSRDGTKMLTAAHKTQVAQVWDARTGKRLGRPAPTFAVAVCVDFSPDGRRFLTAEGWGNGSIRVWETDSGKQVGRTMNWFENNFSALFSPDGSRLVTTNFGTETLIWDSDTGERVGPPIWHGSPVCCVDYRADGQVIATGTLNRVCLWKVAPGMLRWKAPVPDRVCTDIAFPPHGREVLIAPRGRFDRKTGQPITPFYDSVPPFQLRTLAVNPAGHVYGGAIEEIYYWPDGPDRPAKIIARMNAERIALSPDGKRLLASWPWTGNACLLDARTGKVIRRLDTTHNVWGMYWTPDGKTAITAKPNNLRLWDGLTGESRSKTLPRNTVAGSFSFHPGGNIVTAGTRRFGVRQWDLKTWKEVGPRLPHQGLVRHTAYSRDGRLILTTDAFAMRIWHPATGKPIGPRLQGDLPAVSPDNLDFALFGSDGKLCLYSLPLRRQGEPDEVADQISRLTGQRLDERGGLIRTDPRLGGTDSGSR